MNYYNEFDPKAAAWLRELIAQGEIPPGHVDERSITDIKPDELSGFIQLHFFAGIGGWSLALKLAGWAPDRPVWTGSCPCQPFSAAGKGRAQKDERHLWPELLRLIRACRPAIVFGEQVASSEVVGSQLEIAFVDAVEAGDFAKANKLARRLAQSSSFHFSPRWLDGISADMEAESYTLWPLVLGAHSKGSPHLRQRLFWMAHTHQPLANEGRQQRGGRLLQSPQDAAALPVADATNGRGPEHGSKPGQRRDEGPHDASERGGVGGMVHAVGAGLERHAGNGNHGYEPGRLDTPAHGPVAATGGAGDRQFLSSSTAEHSLLKREDTPGSDCKRDRGSVCVQGPGRVGVQFSAEASPWSDFDILPCLDGKARRVESGTFPLAHGVSGRVGLLRGYGNAIVPQVAAEFIQASLEAIALTQ